MSQPMQYMPVRSSDVATRPPWPVRSRLSSAALIPATIVMPGHVVAEPAADARRQLAGRHERLGHRRAGPEHADVVARPVAVGTVEAVAGDAGVDEARVRAEQAPWSRPRRSRASGRRLVTKTSAVASRRCIASRPRPSEVEHHQRLPRLSSSKGGADGDVDPERAEDPALRVTRRGAPPSRRRRPSRPGCRPPPARRPRPPAPPPGSPRASDPLRAIRPLLRASAVASTVHSPAEREDAHSSVTVPAPPSTSTSARRRGCGWRSPSPTPRTGCRAPAHRDRVAVHRADAHDHPGRGHEQRRPRRVGLRRDQDVARLEAERVAGVGDHPGDAAHDAGTAGRSHEHVAGLWPARTSRRPSGARLDNGGMPLSPSTK